MYAFREIIIIINIIWENSDWDRSKIYNLIFGKNYEFSFQKFRNLNGNNIILHIIKNNTGTLGFRILT